MASAQREIRRRIRSISGTRKVTKAMELVASAKMRRTVQAVLATRPYATRAWDLLTRLAAKTEPVVHSLLRRGRGNRIGLVLISSNRGLVGGFNAQLLHAVAVFISRSMKTRPDVILFGKKGRSLVFKHGYRAAAEFEKLDVVSRIEEIRPLARLIIDDFRRGTYDRIVLAYTDFFSTLLQKPRIRQLLPLQRDEALGEVSSVPTDQPVIIEGNMFHEYLFEPNADAVLSALLPRLVEMQLYQAVLESNASEHAARMVAMKNASDAAADLIDDLTLSYNQARQTSITQDLAEISASRAALEG